MIWCVDAQIAALDGQLEQAARQERWAPGVQVLCSFREISTRTALGLLCEIGDLRRFASARELMSYLGLVPSEYSSGPERHRGHITKAGPKEARRLLVEAAWHYRHAPPGSPSASAPPTPPWTRRSPRVPGRPRLACAIATAPSPSNTTSAPPSPTSPSPASWPGSCGPP